MSGAKRKSVRGIAEAANLARSIVPAKMPAARRWVLSAGEHAENGLVVAEHLYPESAEGIKALRVVAFSIRRNEPGLGDDPLSGNEIISLLGLEPGPRIGEAKKWLREQQIANGPLSQRAARKMLRQWHEQA